ncbi:hypothetical protein B0H13DRAFT_2307206 [Mycena leptocephala]|nr:hypothetical protein B0H13DRAFT_2307206 [Mycena leptocephala]
MDKFYDVVNASKALEQLSAARRGAVEHAAISGIKHLADFEGDSVNIIETGVANKNWRLCAISEEEDMADELVFRVQGIILKNNLIPRNLESLPSRKRAYVAQYIEICGLEADTFRDAMTKTEEINQRFAEHFSTTNVVDLVRPQTSFGLAFSSSNRFFTLKTDAPTEQDNTFSDGVDPVGVLEKMKTRDLIHAPENIVKYFKCFPNTDDASKVRYEETIPGAFKVGDLVEIQVSFVGVFTAQNEVKVTSRLQAVTLLDASFTKAAQTARSHSKYEPKAKHSLRRKVGYFYQDEEELTRVAKKRMEVDSA